METNTVFTPPGQLPEIDVPDAGESYTGSIRRALSRNRGSEGESHSIQEELDRWFGKHGRNRDAWFSFCEAYSTQKVCPITASERSKIDPRALEVPRNVSADLVREIGSKHWTRFCGEVGDDGKKIVPSLTERVVLNVSIEEYRSLCDSFSDRDIIEIAAPVLDKDGKAIRDPKTGYVKIEKVHVLKRDHETRRMRERLCSSLCLTPEQFDRMVEDRAAQ